MSGPVRYWSGGHLGVLHVADPTAPADRSALSPADEHAVRVLALERGETFEQALRAVNGLVACGLSVDQACQSLRAGPGGPANFYQKGNQTMMPGESFQRAQDQVRRLALEIERISDESGVQTADILSQLLSVCRHRADRQAMHYARQGDARDRADQGLLTEDEAQKALGIMRRKGCSWQDAMDLAVSGR